MKKFLSMLLCLLLLSSLCLAVSPELKNREHRAMHWIVNVAPHRDKDGDLRAAGCTAYAIAPHVLLTAQHCDVQDGILFIDASYDQIRAGSVQSYGVTEKVIDHRDHMLLVVPGENFTDTITYDPDTYQAPYQGEHVYFWGNPSGIRNIYREGYVMGEFPPAKELPDLKDAPIITLDMPCVGGDSGSAIFDADTGAIVAVLTYGMNDGDWTGVYPLQFSKAQVVEAESRKDAVPPSQPLPAPVPKSPLRIPFFTKRVF